MKTLIINGPSELTLERTFNDMDTYKMAIAGARLLFESGMATSFMFSESMEAGMSVSITILSDKASGTING